MTAETEKNNMLYFCMVLALVLILRVISLWFNNSELFFDEAQYWFWSTGLEFGYFSKPPLLAWVISVTTSVCGSQSEFCVRLAAPLLHVGTAVFIYLTAEKLFDPRTALWSGITYTFLPAVTLSSTIISTDVPLLLCWSVALYAYVRLSEEFKLNWVLLLGLAIGLGLNAKYAMVYFVGCAIIHTLSAQQDLTPARKSGFWIALAIAAAMMIPNLLWNMEHGFVTITHTGENIGWQGFDLNWRGFGEFFGSQFGVFGPILFGMFLATVFRMFGDSISPAHRLLLSFSLPVLLVILCQSILSKAYANWAAATYVAATILVMEVMVNRVAWGWMRATLALHGFVFVAIAVAVCFAGPGQLLLPGGIQPFARTQGASLIAEAAENLLDEHEYNGLITTDRKLSALMQYNLRHREEALFAWRVGEVPRDHFQLAVPFQDSLRDPVLVISRTDNMNAYRKGFKGAVNLGHRDIAAGEIKRVYFFRLENHEKFQ